MCGGVSLIGDLSKLDVYRLARYVNHKHGAERIPRRTPSTSSRRRSSPTISSIRLITGSCAPVVGELVERRTSPAALVTLVDQRALDSGRFVTDRDGRTVYEKRTVATFSDVVYVCYRRLRRSVYKRLQGPPIIVVTERAFGFDLRETIINGWEG